MARGIYVSDADVEMSKDIESLRIDRHLVSDLSSLVPGRKRKIIDRIEEYGTKNPLAVIPILVKHFDDDNNKVRRQVRASLARLTVTWANSFTTRPGDWSHTGFSQMVQACIFLELAFYA